MAYGGGGDRSMDMIVLAFLFLALPAFGFVLYSGLDATVYQIRFGIPNTPFNLTFGLSFLTLTVLAVGLMFTVLATVFILQVATGAKILGSGAGQIGGTLVITVIQWAFVLTFLSLFSAVTATALGPAPYNFGLYYTMLFFIVGLIGIALHLRSAGT